MADASGSERVADDHLSGVMDRSRGSFGPNAWLVEDMYERFVADSGSVSESWREFFADYRPAPLPAPAPPLARPLGDDTRPAPTAAPLDAPPGDRPAHSNGATPPV